MATIPMPRSLQASASVDLPSDLPGEEDVHLAKGTVVSVRDGLVLVETTRGRIGCALAFDCLVAPRAGDLVLVVRDGDRPPGSASAPPRGHVLRVLDRPDGADSLVLGDPRRRLSLTASDLALHGSGRLSMTARDIAVEAASAFSVIGRVLSLAGERLTEVFRLRRTSAEDSLVQATRSSEICHDRLVKVSGVSTVLAEASVEQTAGIKIEHSTATVTSADEDIRMDAKRVTVG